MRKIVLSISIAAFFASCGDKANQETAINDWQDMETELQEKLIMAEDGAVIDLPEGHFSFKGTLSLDGKKNITLKGAGIDKTIFSFKGQTDGAEGLKVNDCEGLIIDGLTLQDAKGDIIKAQKVNKLTIRNVKAEWTGEPQETNGSYAFYPVDCDTVLLDNCIAIGASDAGIYVGQSRDIIVKNCEAYHNVAGIEIENCIRADVFDNLAHENTGGILVFDMPGLTQSGSGVRVFNNRSHDNNFRNFAPEGNIVGEVPPGTGVMVLATKQVEIFSNDIKDNKTIGVVVVSYNLVRQSHNDTTFNPYPKGIYIHDNKIDKGGLAAPAMDYDMVKLLFLKFPLNRPDILIDGYLDPSLETANGNYVGENRICVGDNNGARFANADAPNDFKNASTDRTNFDCELTSLPEVKL